MSTFKKGKVVMLPTNEKVINIKEYQLLLSDSLFWTSKIEIERYTEGWFFLKNSSNHNSCAITIQNVENFKHQHLYTISDDKIKLFDWVYNNKENIVEQITSKTQLIFVLEENKENQTFKKIIATTDKTLSQTSRTEIPQPSQQFIQKFVEEYNKGNVITDVLVEYEYLLDDNGVIPYWNLKVNPKDNTITIKKVKNSYSREEVIELCKQAFIDGTYAGGFGPNEKTINSETEKWVEENL